MEGINFRNGVTPIDGAACPRCGAEAMRLHTWLFGKDVKKPRHYVDCAACRGVAPWRDTPEEAAEAYARGEEPEAGRPGGTPEKSWENGRGGETSVRDAT